jgi:hypothetical protein
MVRHGRGSQVVRGLLQARLAGYELRSVKFASQVIEGPGSTREGRRYPRRPKSGALRVSPTRGWDTLVSLRAARITAQDRRDQCGFPKDELEMPYREFYAGLTAVPKGRTGSAAI